MMTMSFRHAATTGRTQEASWPTPSEPTTGWEARRAVRGQDAPGVPHLYGLMIRPEQVLWVFDRLGERQRRGPRRFQPLGIIGYDPDAFFAALRPPPVAHPPADSGRHGHRDFKQDLELDPGQGDGGFRQIRAAALDRAGYRGDVSLEFEYRDMTLDDIEKEFDAGIPPPGRLRLAIPPGSETMTDQTSAPRSTFPPSDDVHAFRTKL